MIRRSWIRSRLCYRVLVHTTNDDSVSGVLVRDASDGLVLEAAKLESGDRPTALSGPVFIPRATVRMIQELREAPEK